MGIRDQEATNPGKVNIILLVASSYRNPASKLRQKRGPLGSSLISTAITAISSLLPYPSLRSRLRGRGREKSGKRKGGGGEGALALRAPPGSILRSLVAAKFRLVNKTIGGVGCHCMLT